LSPDALNDIAARVPINVRARGRWAHRFTVWLDNRLHEGRAGFYVVTPLALDNGTAVLVNRGWIARDAQNRLRLPDIGAPTEPIVLDGLALPQVSRLFELGQEPRSASWPVVWQNLDFDAFEHASGMKVARFVIHQRSENDDRLLRKWPAPQTGAEKNRGYAVQWYSMSALIVGLTLFFGLRAWRRSRVAGSKPS